MAGLVGTKEKSPAAALTKFSAAVPVVKLCDIVEADPSNRIPPCAFSMAKLFLIIVRKQLTS